MGCFFSKTQVFLNPDLEAPLITENNQTRCVHENWEIAWVSAFFHKIAY